MPDPEHSNESYYGMSPETSVVCNWHNENHPGSFKFCRKQPCAAVKLVNTERI